MTNEEAINLIGQLRMYISGGGVIDRHLDEAVQMAIDALKELGNQSQEINNPNDCISRQVAIDAFLTELTKRERKNLLHTWSTVEVKYFVADMLEKLPSAQPYTDEQIQKMQDMEQVEIEKAFELGREDARAEIIHCGECKHKGTKNCVANVWTNVWGAILGVTVKDDFYCGLAERRTND